jgi:hypothetical protein
LIGPQVDELWKAGYRYKDETTNELYREMNEVA